MKPFDLEDEINKSIKDLDGCEIRDDDGNPEAHLVMDADLRNFARHFFDLGSKDVITPPKPEPYPLTLQDIERIHTFLYAIKNHKQGTFTFTRLSDEQYQEVLDRFNKTRK